MKKEIMCQFVNWIRVRVLGHSIPFLWIGSVIPEKPEEHIIYISKEEGKLTYLLMRCPCGCGDQIELSLIENLSPCWQVVFHWNGTLSITPSIWRRKKCKSHFFYQKGQIKWCDQK